MSLGQIRKKYHRRVCEQILHIREGVPNIADRSSKSSVAIAYGMVCDLHSCFAPQPPSGQTAGVLFEQITRDFLEEAFRLLSHLRPGKWMFSLNQNISQFEQYRHVANLHRLLKEQPELASALGGDYLVTPDIIVARYPVSDREINRKTEVLGEKDPLSHLTPLRSQNRSESTCLLHASISCKWTMRSDRAQNIRTEALNLIRNRKGHTPHIVAVTAEPLPTRLASLALGTGDMDCVYHFALPELEEAIKNCGAEDQLEVLTGMIRGRRLRDISDLPFDLAI